MGLVDRLLTPCLDWVSPGCVRFRGPACTLLTDSRPIGSPAFRSRISTAKNSSSANAVSTTARTTRARDSDVEAALLKVMSQLDRLCAETMPTSRQPAPRQFDVVTGSPPGPTRGKCTDPSASHLRHDLVTSALGIDAVDAGARAPRARGDRSARSRRAAAVDVIAAGKPPRR